MFDELVESSASRTKTNQGWAVALSALVQAGVLGVFVLIPLVYTEALPQKFLNIFLASPPARPSAPPAAASSRNTPRDAKDVAHWIQPGMLIAPTQIPTAVVISKEEEAPDVGAGCSNCVANGIPGGDSGVPNGIIGSTGVIPPPPPTAKRAPQVIRVGGNVQAARIIHQVQPSYPAIAKTAHITGTVVLHAVIGKDGSVEELQYVSGPAALMRNAMDAVRQWRYQPTLLDGNPVEVDTTISVVFTLGG